MKGHPALAAPQRPLGAQNDRLVTGLVWPHDRAEGRSESSVQLSDSAIEALASFSREAGWSIQDILRALVHVLLYRYLDEDLTTRFEWLDGEWVRFRRALGGGTCFGALLAAGDDTGDCCTAAPVAGDLFLASSRECARQGDYGVIALWLSDDWTRLHVEGVAPVAAIERLAVHAARLLAHAVRSPEVALDDLDLLDEADLLELAEIAGPTIAFEGPDTIDGLFLDQVARTPENIAVSCKNERLTYRQLEDRSARQARALLAAGVSAGSTIAVFMHRSCALLVGILAAHRCGAGVLLLDPGQTAGRLTAMLRLSGTNIVIGKGPAPGFLENGQVWIDMDGATADIDDDPDARSSLPGASGNGIAYVIFTSGSTAEPKGLAVSHAAMANRMRWLALVYRLGEQDVSLARTAQSFDPAWCEMLRLLCVGGRTHFLETGAERDPAAVVRVISAEHVTVIDLVPAPLRALLEYSRAFGVAAQLGSLRWVLAGAEELTGALVSSFRQVLGGGKARLINGWGATETTVDATWQDCTNLSDEAPAPLGRPIANCAVHILSRSGRLMPLGMKGELAVTGACLALGYLDRDEASAQRFAEVPALDNRRSYLSGDAARMSCSGILHFVGRSGAFIKIRDVRVAPGTILDLARKRDDVSDAVLHKVSGSESGDEDVVLFVVPREGAELRAEEVRAFLAQRLPAVMLPDRCVIIAAVPRNASEKIDFGALGALLERETPGEFASALAEADGVLSWVCKTFGALIGGNHGPDTDFFRSGGNSLTAVRLVARIADELGLWLTVRDVYEAPTPADLAKRIAQAPPLDSADLEAEVDGNATHAQRRFWILSRDARKSLAYHVPLDIRLSGCWELAPLQRALDSLVERHEILRTTFRLSGQELEQVVHPFTPDMLRAELTERSMDTAEEDVLGRLHGRPFDLASGPLLRIGLLRSNGSPDVLWMTQHHIITDAWSMGLLVDALEDAYRAALQGAAIDEDPLRLQHRNVAAWQSRWLAGPSGALARDYWQSSLDPLPHRLQLPTDRPRRIDRTCEGAVLQISLPTGIAGDFLDLALRRDASPFMAFTSLVGVLLHCWSGQPDFILGAPFAGRTRQCLEDQLGCFVNSLPLRMKISGQDTFHDVLGRVREVCLGALEHQLYPFDLIVRDLARSDKPGLDALFDVMVVVQNTPEPRGKALAGEVRLAETELEQSKLDLIFTFVERAGHWTMRLDYDATLFDASSIRRLAEQFCAMMEVFGQAPTCPVADVFIPAADTDEFLGDDQPLHADFEQWARHAPDRTALVYGERRRSYGELDFAATHLAEVLMDELGEESGVVAIQLDRTDRIVEVQLAILKAGHAFLTLNPADPPQRLHDLLEDSGALAVIEDRIHRIQAEVPPTCRRICLDAPEKRRRGGEPLPRRLVQPQDAAYVIYTSGSTGRPKGVLVAHSSARSLVLAAEEVIAPHGQEAWSVFHAFHFDFSIWETFVPLSRGGRVVLLGERDRRNPRALAERISEDGITVLSQVPSAFDHLAPELVRLRASGLKWVVFGGEPVNLTLLHAIMPQLPQTTFLNGYGITETTVFSSFKRLGADTALQNVGRSIGNQKIWILDDRLRPVLEGAIGEICIGGPAVALGYVNGSERDAARFAFLPHAPATRIYRSGDFGRWDGEGNLIFLGRRDRQVKHHGHRIELEEIRIAGLAIPGVTEAAVLPPRDDHMGELILIVVVSDPATSVQRIRSILSERLPPYMLPARIEITEAFPRLSNGKVDMAALADKLVDAGRPQPIPAVIETDDAEANEPLVAILHAMRSAIDAPALGADDDFFAHGGHSLAAIRVFAEIEARLGCAFELEAIFEHPTARALAAALFTTEAPSCADEPAEPLDTYPASALQAGLWAIAHFQSPELPNTLVERCRLPDDLDLSRCEQAFFAVFEKFDIFRTTFALEAGVLVQKIDAQPSARAGLRIVELDHGADLEACLAEIMRSEGLAPFDLLEGPLVRLVVVKAEGEAVLLCAAHHAVWDGASLDLTLTAWERAYAALGEGRAPPARSDREQYITFLRRQQDRLTTPGGEAALAFWRGRSDGGGRIGHLLPQPVSRERYIGQSERFEMGPVGFGKLRSLCAATGTTLFAGLQALIRSWVWSRWAVTEVAIGSPVMCRQGLDFSVSPGPFINHAVLRCRVTGADSLSEVVAKAGEEVRLGLKHAGISAEEAAPGGNRLFDIGLTLQSSEGARRILDHPGADPRVFGLHTALWFDVTPVDGDLSFDLVANLDHFDPARIRDILREIRATFEALLGRPEDPIAEVVPRRARPRLAIDVG